MFSLTKDLITDILSNTMPSFQVTDLKTNNLGFGFIFYSLVRSVRPMNVVVIGSKAGFSPIMFGLGLRDNEGGEIKKVDCEEVILKYSLTPQLHFIDPSYSVVNKDKNHWYGIGKWDSEEEVYNLWKKYHLEDIITHFKQTSAEYLLNTNSFKEIDLLYVDGDHSYAGIMHDFKNFYPKLKKDAIIIAHDVDPQLKKDFPSTDTLDIAGGFDAFTDIPDEMYEKFRLPIYPGLAIMRKR